MEYRIKKVTTDGVIYYPQYRYTGWRRIFGWWYLKDGFDNLKWYFRLEAAAVAISNDIDQRNPKVEYFTFPLTNL
jgi:hypothetical protein